MLKKMLIIIARFLLWLVARVEVIDIDNIPKNQPVIITANHIGFLDGILILSLNEIINHPNLVVIIAEKWQEIGFLRWAVGVLDWIFIDRYNPDIKSIREVLKRMKGNSLMVIAPEGTRSRHGAMIEGKPGASYITAKTKATIVPTAITGTDDRLLKKNLLHFKRMNVKLTFGKPYKLAPMPKETRDEYLKDTTDEIMCRIAALLPPSYRGIYSDHPRLNQLLSNT